MKIFIYFFYISSGFIAVFFSFLSSVLVLSCVRLLDSSPHYPSHLMIVKGGEEEGENPTVSDTNIFTSVLYKKCKRRVFKR